MLTLCPLNFSVDIYHHNTHILRNRGGGREEQGNLWNHLEVSCWHTEPMMMAQYL
uniref:Uncharacterized protein n=1 Tax=Anguilla anguilla TaxID=7936 RepID=A0A0E9X3T3_ANGAN